jgi:APA family basic amino acid/polyamine antiporter
MSLATRKSIADLQEEAAKPTLRRALGPLNLTALGIGSVIGTGIFVLTGTAASQNAGPALVLSMIIAAVACAFAGLCYAELASMIPVAGSAYTYAYASSGEFIAWIIGWDLTLEYALSGATVAVGWSGYLVSLLRDLGIALPAPLTVARYATAVAPDASVVPGIFNLPATVIVLLVTFLLVIGISPPVPTRCW